MTEWSRFLRAAGVCLLGGAAAAAGERRAPARVYTNEDLDRVSVREAPIQVGSGDTHDAGSVRIQRELGEHQTVGGVKQTEARRVALARVDRRRPRRQYHLGAAVGVEIGERHGARREWRGERQVELYQACCPIIAEEPRFREPETDQDIGVTVAIDVAHGD